MMDVCVILMITLSKQYYRAYSKRMLCEMAWWGMLAARPLYIAVSYVSGQYVEVALSAACEAINLRCYIADRVRFAFVAQLPLIAAHGECAGCGGALRGSGLRLPCGHAFHEECLWDLASDTDCCPQCWTVMGAQQEEPEKEEDAREPQREEDAREPQKEEDLGEQRPLPAVVGELRDLMASLMEARDGLEEVALDLANRLEM
jgi:hypothetical protein